MQESSEGGWKQAWEEALELVGDIELSNKRRCIVSSIVLGLEALTGGRSRVFQSLIQISLTSPIVTKSAISACTRVGLGNPNRVRMAEQMGLVLHAKQSMLLVGQTSVTALEQRIGISSVALLSLFIYFYGSGITGNLLLYFFFH